MILYIIRIETKLIKEARKRKKLENVTGLFMFLGQAQKSFKIWFNIYPNLDKYLILKIKKKDTNFMIVLGLTGSVGVGKNRN